MGKGKALRILLAEDDFLVSQEIARVITSIGHEHIGTAPNGVKAVEMTKDMKPDLVMMDIKMPKMNGIEAARIIQDVCPTPIIILTAHETHEFVEKAAEAGVGAYLTKPPQKEAVERAITIAYARQTDIIKQKKLVKELEELNVSKDKFFSIIAHDLRSPLGALIGYSTIVVDDYDEMDESERKGMVNSIRQISVSMHSLLESLLEWSRYETGRMQYNPEMFLIEDCVFSVISLQKPGAVRKGIDLQFDHEKPLMVFADLQMIETVLRNLISNAVKFTERGGTIVINSKDNGESILISISDSGVGMSEDQITELFRIDKSTSTPGTDDEKGSGLGLVLCKELVELNRGKINIESIKGEGTTISFTLPSAEME